MSKADNMLSILWLLKMGKRMTAKQISEVLEIHIRTVYRYIDSLCASGVPIISDAGHNGGYSLLHQFTEVPLFFDSDEQKALIHAALFAEQAGYPFGDELNRAVAKLKLYTNPEQLFDIERHVVGFDVISPPSDSAMEPILQQLEISVADSSTVSMEYISGNGTESKARSLDPYGLVHWKSKWYVIGYCHIRSEIRSFRVDRIQGLSPMDAVFQRPAAFSARQFFMKSLLPDMDKEEKLITVRIQGKPQAINDLCGHWLLGHVLVERSLNEVQFKLEERAVYTYAPYFLMPYGKSVQILEPPLLKERMVSVTSALLDYYKEM
jgi:predicted DNA-binding transcriptional regulator YafY